MRAIFLAVAVLVMSGCGPERVPPEPYDAGPGDAAHVWPRECVRATQIRDDQICDRTPAGLASCYPCMRGCISGVCLN